TLSLPGRTYQNLIPHICRKNSTRQRSSWAGKAEPLQRRKAQLTSESSTRFAGTGCGQSKSPAMRDKTKMVKSLVGTVVLVFALLSLFYMAINSQEVRECHQWSLQKQDGHWTQWQVEQCQSHQVELK